VSYKKLVRDKIPEIIRKNGKEPVTRVLDEKEYLVELVKKLKEEVAEFEADHSVEELADIKEVIIAIREVLNIRGRFKNRIYLEKVKE
jgi:predicted house-cleaning noncanonical NTP pyrophosphatase (MazG superfamily)